MRPRRRDGTESRRRTELTAHWATIGGHLATAGDGWFTPRELALQLRRSVRRNVLDDPNLEVAARDFLAWVGMPDIERPTGRTPKVVKRNAAQLRAVLADVLDPVPAGTVPPPPYIHGDPKVDFTSVQQLLAELLRGSATPNGKGALIDEAGTRNAGLLDLPRPHVWNSKLGDPERRAWFLRRVGEWEAGRPWPNSGTRLDLRGVVADGLRITADSPADRWRAALALHVAHRYAVTARADAYLGAAADLGEPVSAARGFLSEVRRTWLAPVDVDVALLLGAATQPGREPAWLATAREETLEGLLDDAPGSVGRTARCRVAALMELAAADLDPGGLFGERDLGAARSREATVDDVLDAMVELHETRQLLDGLLLVNVEIVGGIDQLYTPRTAPPSRLPTPRRPPEASAWESALRYFEVGQDCGRSLHSRSAPDLDEAHDVMLLLRSGHTARELDGFRRHATTGLGRTLITSLDPGRPALLQSCMQILSPAMWDLLAPESRATFGELAETIRAAVTPMQSPFVARVVRGYATIATKANRHWEAERWIAHARAVAEASLTRDQPSDLFAVNALEAMQQVALAEAGERVRTAEALLTRPARPGRKTEIDAHRILRVSAAARSSYFQAFRLLQNIDDAFELQEQASRGRASSAAWRFNTTQQTARGILVHVLAHEAARGLEIPNRAAIDVRHELEVAAALYRLAIKRMTSPAQWIPLAQIALMYCFLTEDGEFIPAGAEPPDALHPFLCAPTVAGNPGRLNAVGLYDAIRRYQGGRHNAGVIEKVAFGPAVRVLDHGKDTFSSWRRGCRAERAMLPLT